MVWTDAEFCRVRTDYGLAWIYSPPILHSLWCGIGGIHIHILFPLFSYFRGCLSEVVVPSYSVRYLNTHTDTHIHTQTHTNTHTSIYIYIYIYIYIPGNLGFCFDITVPPMMQILEWIRAWRSYLFVWSLRYPFIITMQTYLKALNI